MALGSAALAPSAARTNPTDAHPEAAWSRFLQQAAVHGVPGQDITKFILAKGAGVEPLPALFSVFLAAPVVQAFCAALADPKRGGPLTAAGLRDCVLTSAKAAGARVALRPWLDVWCDPQLRVAQVGVR